MSFIMKLAHYLELNNLSAEVFADQNGWHKTTVYKWISGEREPEASNLRKLFDSTNGQVSAFDFPKYSNLIPHQLNTPGKGDSPGEKQQNGDLIKIKCQTT